MTAFMCSSPQPYSTLIFGVFPLHQIAHVGDSESMGLKLLSINALLNDTIPTHRPTASYYIFPKTGGSQLRNTHPKLQWLLSQEQVKIRTLSDTCIGSIRTKARQKFWRKDSVGLSRDCQHVFGYSLLSQEPVKL